MTTIYDAVPYPRHAYGFTHPDRLATLGLLRGLETPPIERARVLELGCASGANLVPLAYALPQAEFVGIDNSQRQIAEGQEFAAALGLSNIRLETLDICAVDEQLGQFDYIIAQGIYSWVPSAARDAVMRICGQQLSETGVALVSYNAYPGCHLRDMVRGMARFHIRELSEPQEQVDQLHGLIRFLAQSAPDDGGGYTRILRSEAERLGKLVAPFVLHDVLEGTNEPVYFHEFVAHAGRHGLQYLCEALPLERRSFGMDAELLNRLRRECAPLELEQHLDFLDGTAFRRTLVCRGSHALAADRSADIVGRLLLASAARAVSPESKLNDSASAEFRLNKNKFAASLKTDEPIAKAALAILTDNYPRALGLDDLLAAAGSRLGRAARPEERELLAQVAVAGFETHAVELHRWQPAAVGHVSEQPQASPVARYQAAQGWELATLWHERFALSDPVARQLIVALDGRHDRRALVEQLVEAIKASGSVPVKEPFELRRQVADRLEIALADLARSALLIA